MGPRRRRVTWSEGAHRELDEAISYVAEDSPRNAADLLERILQAGASLSELSDRGRILPELGDPSIRELPVEPYRNSSTPWRSRKSLFSASFTAAEASIAGAGPIWVQVEAHSNKELLLRGGLRGLVSNQAAPRTALDGARFCTS
jgi:plasmid stabilization system protein ParE